MSFAVVELKYMPKKTFIVKISWIKNYKPKHMSTEEFYCYISTNLNDDPNFEARYYMKFNGTAGLFKVFILTVKDSVIDAISYQEQKRVKSVPQKFRKPGNTDAELSVENSQRKKKQNVIKKAAQKSAKAKNMAHLAVLLSKTTTAEVNHQNLQIGSKENISLTQVVETESREQVTAAPVDTIMAREPSNPARAVEVECREQMVIAPVDLNPNKTLRNGVTATESKPVSYDSSTVTVQPNGDLLSNVETDIQSEPIVLPIEFPSASTSNSMDIVQLAMEGLEYMDSANVGEYDFGEGIDVNFVDEFRYETNVEIMSESGNNTTNTVPLDVHLSGFYFGNKQEIRGLPVEKSLSTSSSTSVVTKQPEFGRENNGERHDVPIKEFDYKKAYMLLKEQNNSLDERNMALQNALVAADKAMGKVPEVPFASVDGGRLYKEGVYLDEVQCKLLDTAADSNKYVNNLAVAVFGTETLKKSSVTGTASKNKALPAKPGLNPLWLQLVYDLIDAKTNKRMSVSEVNKILNKKISNLNGAEKRRLIELNEKEKQKGNERNKSGPVRNETVVTPNATIEPTVNYLSRTTM